MIHMARSGILLDYAGIVDHKKINHLLNTLKNSKEFLSLDRTTQKRLFARDMIHRNVESYDSDFIDRGINAWTHLVPV
jgi:hypothetical protein